MKFATYNEWTNFVKNGIIPPVRPRVLESWQRCAELISPENAQFKVTPPAANLDAPHIKTIRSCIDNVLKSTTITKVAWIICGAGGEILEIISQNQEIIGYFGKIGLNKNMSLAENSAGTNAVSMAVHYKSPSVCSGCDHFLRNFHPLSSAAAPVYEVDGSLKTFVALFGLQPEADAILLNSIILLLIQLIDREARLLRSKNLHDSLKQQLKQIFTDDLRPMIMVNRSGYLRQINPAAVKFLELDDKLSKIKNLDKAASFEPSLREIAGNAIPVKGREVKITLPSKRLEAEYEKIPMYSENDEFLGCLIVFDEKIGRTQSLLQVVAEARYSFEDIIGNSPALRRAKALAKKAAMTSVNVLLYSPSGTGKEMFAHSIHNASDRKNKPFMAINCAAIPREIAESELFGYAPGSFTGARREGHIGKLEAADGGTVFLDEIGDMPMELQAKLLRLLEERTITRIGGRREIPVDIRIIAATNRNIPELIEKEQFREDLYYRLNVSTITLPMLQESQEDIPALVASFIEMFNENMGKKVKSIQPEIMEAFKNYSWPGNIRELKNAIEFAIMLNTGEETVTWKDLPGQLRTALLYRDPQDISAGNTRDPFQTERLNLENSERALYIKAIRMANGNMSRAADYLGVGRSTIYRKLRKYGLRES